MKKELRACLFFLAVMTFLLGLAYPSAVWAVGKVFFPEEAEGSLVFRDGKLIGSTLVGQPFKGRGLFHSRPSETPLYPYNFMASGSANLNPTNPKLLTRIRNLVREAQAENGSDLPVPADLVTASCSGLDPHISPESAFYQIKRVAAERGFSPETLRTLVLQFVEPRTLGFLGEPRVNVLRLNMALDLLSKKRGAR